MAKIAVDLLGESVEDIEVTCFTIPGPGVCITIRSAANTVEIDLSEAIYTVVMEKIMNPPSSGETLSA